MKRTKRLSRFFPASVLLVGILVGGAAKPASAQTISAPSVTVTLTGLIYGVENAGELQVQVTWDINITGEGTITAEIQILDEYAQFEGMGDWFPGFSSVTLSFPQAVEAGDTDGRTFTLIVRAENEGGTTQASSSFTVPPGGILPPDTGGSDLDALRAELQALKDQRHQLIMEYGANRRELCEQRKAELKAATSREQKRDINAKYRQLLRDLRSAFIDNLRSINSDIREVRRQIQELLKEMRNDDSDGEDDDKDHHDNRDKDKHDNKDHHDDRDKDKHDDKDHHDNRDKDKHDPRWK